MARFRAQCGWGSPPAAQAAQIPSLANAIVEALRDDDALEFIDPAIPEALQMLQAPLQPHGQSEADQPPFANQQIKAGLVEDVVESINNIVKRAVEPVLGTAKEMASGYAHKARESLVKESERLGEETGPAITRWVKRAVFSGGLIAALMQVAPGAFHWLEAIKPFLNLR